MKTTLRIILLVFLLTVSLSFNEGCGTPSAFSKGTQSTEGFSFIYMGDSQADRETGDYKAWGKLLQNAANDNSHPAFIMIGGDLINDGNDKNEWNAFFDAGGDVLKKLDLYPTIGNHDEDGLYKSMFKLPTNGPADRKEAFYSFDHGNAHFTVLDSNVMVDANQRDLDWLKNDLLSTKKKYTIVMFHFPAYPVNSKPYDLSNAATIQKSFVPIMEKAGVDLVLSGHEHAYMRTYPLLNGKRNENGIVYLIGSSGGKYYDTTEFDYEACTIGNTSVYSIIYLDEKGISIETRDISGQVLDSTRGPLLSLEEQKQTITVKGDGIKGKRILKLKEFNGLPNAGFGHVYSTTNNWSTARFYAAKGITLRSILKAAGVLDKAQIITFRSPDGYKVSFTREQLLGRRWYYPLVKEGSFGMAEPVEPIIAYRYREGSADMKAVQTNKPCLIFGQQNPYEHTNVAFVVDVSEIIVSNKPAVLWEAPTTFPKAGGIAAGETVKLQHKYFGMVKLYYTTDGSDPTETSPMYNPSTYQPELNRPISITKDTVIKVLVKGYGKKDSKITSFRFDVQ